MWSWIVDNIFKSIAIGIIDSSYWICLTICMVSILFYIAGEKKAGKWTSLSLLTYVILQAIKPCIK